MARYSVITARSCVGNGVNLSRGEAVMAGNKIIVRPRTDALLLVNLQKAYLPGGSMPIKDAGKAVHACERLATVLNNVYATVLAYPRGSVALASTYRKIAHDVRFVTFAQARGWLSEMRAEPGVVRPIDFFSPDSDLDPERLMRYLEAIAVTGGSQILHPDHAILGTDDAEFAGRFDEVDAVRVDEESIYVLGSDPMCDAWSAFRDRLGRSTELAEDMRRDGVTRVFVGGMPFSTFVHRTVMDGQSLGFQMVLVEDATAGTMPRLQDLWHARGEMQSHGAMSAHVSDVSRSDAAILDLSELICED
jgi:nicotinamidase-related amidase